MSQLDERVRRRVREASLLASAIAHQLGATVLPSVRTTAALDGDRDFQRLAIQTRSVVAHLERQKLALDVFRSRGTGELADHDSQPWVEWVLPLIQCTMTRAERACVDADVTTPVELGVSHAALVAAISVDEQLTERVTLCIEVERGSGGTSPRFRWSQRATTEAPEVPDTLASAARSAGLAIAIAPGSLTLHSSRKKR